MKGYLTKQKVGYTLTIIGNSGIKRHFTIRSLEKFSKRFLKETKESVMKHKGVGQYIVNRLGFCYDCELDYFNKMDFVSP